MENQKDIERKIVDRLIAAKKEWVEAECVARNYMQSKLARIRKPEFSLVGSKGTVQVKCNANFSKFSTETKEKKKELNNCRYLLSKYQLDPNTYISPSVTQFKYADMSPHIRQSLDKFLNDLQEVSKADFDSAVITNYSLSSTVHRKMFELCNSEESFNEFYSVTKHHKVSLKIID